MKKLAIIFSIGCLFLEGALFNKVFAVVDPLQRPNNKFGIHLAVADEQDLEDAARLVNSSGGRWGYVTLVIQENDRNREKWQRVFDKMRRLQLIPIVRLATYPEGNSWRQPNPEDARAWAEFLDSLNWVVKNRYIVLFNEPNHATEWGGRVNPEAYAEVAYAFAKELKKTNEDFFVMLAGFDQAAPNQPPLYLDEAEFFRRMFKRLQENGVNSVFDYIDGLASHSYPNPGFSASPYALGKGSVRGYLWELSYLSYLGVGKSLPVFITETGWLRGSETKVAENFRAAFTNVWLPDPQVVAVTPFVLNYQSQPFLGFSWKKEGSDEFYPQYEVIQQLAKPAGDPEQVTEIKLLTVLPNRLVEGSRFAFKIRVRNSGQSIWDSRDGYSLALISNDNFKYNFSQLTEVFPDQEQELLFYLETPKGVNKYQAQIAVTKEEEVVSNLLNWNIQTTPQTDLELSYNLLLNFKKAVGDFQVEIYDEDERLVYKKQGASGQNGKILLEKIPNIALSKRYRVVLLKPLYLPRQVFVTFKQSGNKAKLPAHLPLDWNSDGKWSARDFLWFVN